MSTGDTCTLIYGLPYPTGASAPCNIGTTQCAFDDAVQQEIDRLSTVVDRTFTTIPMVKVALTVPTVFNTDSPSQAFVFDTVLVDTDNMFTSSFPDQVTVNTPGLYGSFAMIYSTSTTSATTLTGSTIRVDIAGLLGNFSLEQLTYPSGTPVYQSGSGTWPVSTSGTIVNMTYSPFIQSTDIVIVQRAEMGLFWLGDLP